MLSEFSLFFWVCVTVSFNFKEDLLGYNTSMYHKNNKRYSDHQKTSWGKVASWYEKSVGEKGHYFHKQIILPGVLRLLSLEPGMSLLDLGCGQGVLERALPKGIAYTGVDVAADLVAYAKTHSQHEKHVFLTADVTQPLMLPPTSFDRLTIVLALQNMHNWDGVFNNIQSLLKAGGRAVIVLNHPYFRIPRQTAWGDDERTKQQYRKVYRYMSAMEIPIEMDPGRGGSKITWSYHRPLHEFVSLATSRGMVISGMEEWSSDKVSEGSKAKMENRARNEIPLFMAIVMTKS